MTPHTERASEVLTSPHPERGAIIIEEADHGGYWAHRQHREYWSWGLTTEEAKANLIQQERDRGES